METVMSRLTRKLMMIAAAAAAVGGTGGGAVLAALSTPAAAGAAHPRVVVFTCLGGPQVRPGSFVLTCADDNSYLTGLSWSRWTAGSAAGTGTWHINDCAPDCAHGHFLTYPVEVTFWPPPPVTTHPAERPFTRITLSATSPLGQERP